ncbi:helix-turn-helix domain-containing protein [Paenibacillus lignilyticus]|uniref:Helix-turn-helix domain-containing protein n=1 Tax=Paenibacillus lignilyticus TaxID=1172615 RepID=A0ABS5C6L8_9BACL|nr:helix-turn-helix domain-containing protein [Paenibacillus lignilyticus]MBP3963730.1 helix-turn-helix domain-containing protein [Paenibacillus lignilyticus]
MNVLIVDDQTQVVDGLFFGIDWAKIGVKDVLKAYNAFEAREILSSRPIDIMLCDIEMPAETGLSLYQWTRDRKIDIECIFLTAHADFTYAKTAMQLGGFDYILQPARYETIESTIRNAIQKIIQKNETKKYYAYGKMFQQNKEILLDNIFKDWIFRKSKDSASFIKELSQIQVSLDPQDQVYLVTLNVFRLKETMESWRNGMLKFTIGNIVTELFARYGQQVLVAQIEDGKLLLLVYSPERQLIDQEGVLRQLNKLIEVYHAYYGCDIACYTGDRIVVSEAPEQAGQLLEMMQNNVSLASKVFHLKDRIEQQTVSYSIPNVRMWSKLLEQGDTEVVHDQACALLNQLAIDGKIDAEFLKRFYQQFMQMLYTTAETRDIPLDRIFQDEHRLEKWLNSYSNVDDMKELIAYTTKFFKLFPGSEEEMKNQVDLIIQYIRDHIDQDIRRTDIAREVYLNPNYLSRLFKSETGTSLKEFIVTEKMKLAQAMLKSTKLPISIIAMKVGYANFSHFSQVYKKTYNVTPAEDRG